MPLDEAVMDEPIVDDVAGDEGVDESGSNGAEEEEHVDDTLGDEPEGDEGDEGAGDDEGAEGDQQAAAQDGRKMPDAIKKGLKAVQAVDPTTAKLFKSNYFENQEFRSLLGTPQEAAEFKATIEAIGGKEGIEQIESERQEWAEIDRGFAEGKPEFVKGIADANPEAFLKTATNVVNEWASRAPDQYQYYANTVAHNTIMAQPGVAESLQALHGLYGQLSDAPWAQQAIASVINGIVGLKEKASQYEQKRVDPREDALKQRETAFEQKRRGDFEGNVADRAEKYLSEKMQPELDRVIGGRKVDPEAMKGYQKMVQSEVMRRLGEIPGFENQLEANYRTGDTEKSVAYITAKYNQILPEAVKVVAPYLRNIAPSKSTPTKREQGDGNRLAAAGEITLREMPDYDKIDFNKCTVADVMQGHAVLKSGKTARGWA